MSGWIAFGAINELINDFDRHHTPSIAQQAWAFKAKLTTLSSHLATRNFRRNDHAFRFGKNSYVKYLNLSRSGIKIPPKTVDSWLAFPHCVYQKMISLVGTVTKCWLPQVKTEELWSVFVFLNIKSWSMFYSCYRGLEWACYTLISLLIAKFWMSSVRLGSDGFLSWDT